MATGPRVKEVSKFCKSVELNLSYKDKNQTLAEMFYCNNFFRVSFGDRFNNFELSYHYQTAVNWRNLDFLAKQGSQEMAQL